MPIVHVFGGNPNHLRINVYGGIEEHFKEIKKQSNEKVYFILNAKPSSEEYNNWLKQNYNSLVVVGTGYYNFIKGYIKFMKKLKEESGNIVVHVHFQPLSYLLVIISKIIGMKDIYWTKHSRLLINKWNLTWIYHKIAMKYVKKVICVSNAIEKELHILDLGKNKTIVCPLGVNLLKYNIDITSDEKNQLYDEFNIKNRNSFIISIVSQQRIEKKVDVFIKAFAKFIHENKVEDAVGLIIGGGPLENENIKLAKELNIYDKLRFIGVRKDINRIYKCSNLAGLTSLTEGLPLALLEAAACELPLFGSNVGGIPEIIKDGYNGFLFNEGDIIKLSDIFWKLYKESSLRDKMGKKSLELVRKKYDLNKCVGDLIKIYEEE